MSRIALIKAAGTGSRMHAEIPKQFMSVNDRPLILYTLAAFQKHPEIDSIAVICLSGWERIIEAYAREDGISKLCHIIPGGGTGHASIANGVFELEKHYSREDLVLIHDGNRPMVSSEIISDSIAVAERYGNSVTVIPCEEVILKIDNQESSYQSIARETLRWTQTPHTFRLGDACDMYREAERTGKVNTAATCSLATELGRRVFFSKGSPKNLKITTRDDLDIFNALLMQESGK